MNDDIYDIGVLLSKIIRELRIANLLKFAEITEYTGVVVEHHQHAFHLMRMRLKKESDIDEKN